MVGTRTLFMLFCVVVCGLVLLPGSSAEEGAPINGQTMGDWVIENGDNVTCDKVRITVNGDLRIESGGALHLKGCVIEMRGFDDDEPVELLVEEGGGLYTSWSRITSYQKPIDPYQPRPNMPLYYKFIIRGEAIIRRTNMDMMWGAMSGIAGINSYLVMGSSFGGVQIYSDDVLIEDSLIYDGQTVNLYAEDSSPTLRRVRIYRGFFGGAYFLGEGTVVIENCTADETDMGFGFLAKKDSGAPTAYVNNTTVVANMMMGIVATTGADVTIRNSALSGNGNGLYAWGDNTTIRVYNSSIMGSTRRAMGSPYPADVSVMQGGNVTLFDCMVDPDHVHVAEGGNATMTWTTTISTVDADGEPLDAAVSIRNNLTGEILDLRTSGEGVASLYLPGLWKNGSLNVTIRHTASAKSGSLSGETRFKLSSASGVTIILMRSLNLVYAVGGTAVVAGAGIGAVSRFRPELLARLRPGTG